MRKRFIISIVVLVLSAVPAIAFMFFTYLILTLYLQSQGVIYWHIFKSRVEIISSTGRGYYFPILTLVTTAIFFSLFIGSLIVFTYDLRAILKARRARKEGVRKSYTI